MTSPFDDPEFRAQMEAMGVVHKPGMAKEMLGEIAPLLADEGFDLDDLDAADLDAVNAALARATERHNLTLFTPVGAHLDGAFALLRQFTLAIAEENLVLAEALLGGIPSDPEPTVPAISHVIGVSLGLLDERQTDAALRRVKARMRVPEWRSKRSKAAARDIAALAAKGRAFDSLQELHGRHSGLAISEGGALAVAASVIAQAKIEGVLIDDLVSRVLDSQGSGSPSGSSFGAGSSSGTGAGPSFGAGAGSSFGTGAGASSATGASFGLAPAASSDALVRKFRAWLQQEPQIAAPDVASEIRMFTVLQSIAGDELLALTDPDDIDPLVDALLDIAEEAGDDDESRQAVEHLLHTLDDYLHFRLDTAEDPEVWEEAHASLEEVLRDDSSIMPALQEIAAAAEAVDAEERRAALWSLPIVQAVREILEWVGAGRAITSSGGLRRAEIEHVAGLIGVSAVGVQKRPAREDREDSRIYAQSMWDVPALASWWWALNATGVLSMSVTRVYAGEQAELWRGATVPPVDLLEFLVSVFVAEVVTGAGRGTTDGFDVAVDAETFARTVRALTYDGEHSDAELPTTFMTPMALRRLKHLESAGLLERVADGSFTVVEPLRAAVARGVMLAVLSPMMAEMAADT
ncbi:hypothetical protein FM104_15080 [Microbacterium esteraromaticum]|uniref:Uncharacterized protein n=1 Tax=Microbacterium esteraromaticum TaxID=57043 RepID=A0A1R4KQC5_9MICO|nr:hypothetical protein [Microbacterium esteraromaticum]SJN46596.1 hypothetical protein FM104_15080 [Microbacterium esteraromaticum]